MNPAELFNFLTELVRQGPAAIAALVVGILGGAWLGWRLARASRGSEHVGLTTQIAKLENELQHRDRDKDQWALEKCQLQERCQKAEADQVLARSTEANLHQELERRQARVVKLEGELRARAGENAGLKTRNARLLEKGKQWQDWGRSREQERQRLDKAVHQYQHDIASLKAERGHLSGELTSLRTERAKLQEVVAAQERKCEDLLTESEDLKAKLRQTKREAKEAEKEAERLVGQIEGVLKLDGKVWAIPVVESAPAFRPLGERRVPVISIVNLKGGVGKTTIVANLGAALARPGGKVLPIDLDYQSSLSSLCINNSEIRKLNVAQRAIQCFLERPSPDADGLLHCAVAVPKTECDLIVAGDELADVEMQLMAAWLLGKVAGDIRFTLRRALHDVAVEEKYAYILLDCPPRFTTACINALVASDYVLIPVVPDATSALAVPRLFRQLRDLKTDLLKHLAVLGVVANRTSKKLELVSREQDVWSELQENCPIIWGEKIYHFETIIPQSVKFAAAANSGTLAALDTELTPTFLDLVQELKGKVTHEGFRPARVF
jgi:cellulose biosynthesis protein BcsQ